MLAGGRGVHIDHVNDLIAVDHVFAGFPLADEHFGFRELQLAVFIVDVFAVGVLHGQLIAQLAGFHIGGDHFFHLFGHGLFQIVRHRILAVVAAHGEGRQFQVFLAVRVPDHPEFAFPGDGPAFSVGGEGAAFRCSEQRVHAKLLGHGVAHDEGVHRQAAEHLGGLAFAQAVDLIRAACLLQSIGLSVIFKARAGLHRRFQRFLKAGVHFFALVIHALQRRGDGIALGLAAGVGIGDAVIFKTAAGRIVQDRGLRRLIQPFHRAAGIGDLLAHLAVGADLRHGAAVGADFRDLHRGHAVYVVH